MASYPDAVVSIYDTLQHREFPVLQVLIFHPWSRFIGQDNRTGTREKGHDTANYQLLFVIG